MDYLNVSTLDLFHSTGWKDCLVFCVYFKVMVASLTQVSLLFQSI